MSIIGTSVFKGEQICVNRGMSAKVIVCNGEKMKNEFERANETRRERNKGKQNNN